MWVKCRKGEFGEYFLYGKVLLVLILVGIASDLEGGRILDVEGVWRF